MFTDEIKVLIIAAFALFLIAALKNLAARLDANTEEVKQDREENKKHNEKRDQRGDEILAIAKRAVAGRRKVHVAKRKGDEELPEVRAADVSPEGEQRRDLEES